MLENSFSLQRESDKEKNETCIASKHLFTKFTFTYHFSRGLGQLGRSRKIKSKNFLFIEVRHSSFHQSHQRMKKSPSVKTIIYKNTWLSYLFCISINVLDLYLRGDHGTKTWQLFSIFYISQILILLQRQKCIWI